MEKQCSFCPLTFPADYVLALHTFTDHKFSCQDCGLEMTDRDSLLMHSLYCASGQRELDVHDVIQEIVDKNPSIFDHRGHFL